MEKNKKRVTCGSPTLNNRDFHIVKEYKYLGNIISFNLRDESDKKLNKILFICLSFHYTDHLLGLTWKLYCFNSYCCAQYGVLLWNSHENI